MNKGIKQFVSKLQAGKIIPNTFSSVFNRGVFQSLPYSKQLKLFRTIGNRVNPNPMDLTLNLIHQPYANEIQNTLRNSVALANQDKFPFGVIQLNNGTFVHLRGNLEELGRTYYAMQNGIIMPEHPIIRGHYLSLQQGVSPGAEAFFGAQGLDQGAIAPYFWSQKVNGKGKLGDIFTGRTENTNYYNGVANAIYDEGNRLASLFDKAVLAGDYDSAAQIYVQLSALPEFEQPLLLDRMKRVVPYSETLAKSNKKYVPESAQREVRRMFRQGIEDGTLRSPRIRYALTPSGNVDYNNPRKQIFSGNPEALPAGAGGYYIRSGTSIAEPDFTMTKWNYNTPTAVQVALDRNPEIKGDLEGLKSITTDKIGKAYFSKGYDATLFPVSDFHHTDLANEVSSKAWIPPMLFMSPTEKLYDTIYRVDRWREGLKKGGKITRFKNSLHK